MENFFENYRNVVKNMKTQNNLVEKALRAIKIFEKNRVGIGRW